MPPILYLFALTNLVIGTGAFVLGGILQPMSAALGVSVAAAGQSMTVYALVSAFIAPVLVAVTGHWPRKRAILLALALFTAGCALSALATSLAMLLAGRALMGMGSMFSALASGLAVALVEPARRGRALSLSFLGFSMSYAIGLPLGTWMGFAWGWQAPVWLVTACCVATLAILSIWLPSQIKAPGASFAGLARVGPQGPVWRVWLRTLLYFVAIFSVFGYIGPVLRALNPLTPGELSGVLGLFGLAAIAGTVSGGWAADRFGPVRALRVQMTVLVAMMALLPLTQGYLVPCVAAMLVWGVAGFGMMTPQQSLLAQTAPAHAPLLMSLNGSMLYLGTALGALISGAFIDTLGFARLAWVGLPFGLAALITLAFDTPRHAKP